MYAANATTESASGIAAKASAPVGVSLATVAGFHIHDLVIWATLIYTVLMIGHKAFHIWRDIKRARKEDNGDAN